jgi:tetratricopeptide (TPR) repeat protein
MAAKKRRAFLTARTLRVTIAGHEGRAAMPSGPNERYDFFLSRRGSVAAIAQEVTDVLKEKGYTVFVQDYDIPIAANLIEEMHEAIKNARDLVVLFTRDYEQSPYTRMEFTSFEANAAQSAEHRRMVILRCEDAPLLGLFAPHVYQDLVGIGDAEERRSRILAAVEGRSQALEPPPRPFIGVPPRIASFTGRTNELDRLDTILIHDKPAAVTQASVGRAAVQGMGGVGKTSLAIEYAHRFRGLYAGVCWCPAETRTGLLSALAILAGSLGAATAEEADVEKAAKAALRRLAEQRATWLLVYDNVPTPDAIADLLPSAGVHVLITSRFSDWSELADEVALDVLPLEEAVALLRSRTGRGYAGAQTLAEVLDCLPLALDHAAAYCKRTQMRFADYARKAWSLIDAAPRGAGYPRSVGATFDLAITEAVEQCRAAETLMAYLAQCAPERIPMTLVEGAVEELERMEALAALAEVSLLKHDQFDDSTPAVTVHRLVQAVARARSEADSSAQENVGKLIARLTASYPEDGYDNPQSWSLCAKLTPHLLARRGADDPSVFHLLGRTGEYFHGRAAYSQAAPLLRDALAICEKTLGPEHHDTAGSLNNLANVLRAQGDLAGARPLFERALAIREKALGPEHPDTATCLNNLASVLKAQGDFAGARPLYERALAIREKALGPEHSDTAESLNALAVLLSNEGDFAGARLLLKRALAIGISQVKRSPAAKPLSAHTTSHSEETTI